MWFDEAVFYQIYPLGFCGAERENDFGETRHRFGEIAEEIPRLKELGITAVLFNPLFESERHGYDTADLFRADRRLGTNGELKALVEAFHAAGIRVVFDGVFHHTGRAFPAFREVQRLREGTDKRFWFFVDFNGNSPYGDGFRYADWEGHAELVKLNLENPAVQDYLLSAVRFWIREFGIDGLRLDVCYLLPAWFLEMLRSAVNAEKADFFLMGEVVHCTNYAQNVSPARLDSITNYECCKGMLSSFNSHNLFEIEYSLNRLFGDAPWCLYTGKHLFSFLDNHDISRAASALSDGRDLLPLYALLFTIPGIPCIYYGSEYGARGDKREGDAALRPAMREIARENTELFRYLSALARIRRENPVLCYGGYRKLTLSNEFFSFLRGTEEGGIAVGINLSDGERTVRGLPREGEDLFTGERLFAEEFRLPPHSARVLRIMS